MQPSPLSNMQPVLILLLLWWPVAVVHCSTPEPLADQQQCSSSVPQNYQGYLPKPKAVVTDELMGNMANVRDILQLLDYELTDNPADANIIWAWRDPFSKALIDPEETVLMAAHEQLTKLGNQQYVNQVFGSGYLTTKGELAALSQQLPFLPKTFKLPQQYTAWQEFIKTGGGADMEWIQKSTGHRGISIIADPLASSWASIKQEVLVQQLIRPYLISNRVWDVGFFVAVTQLDPLTAYIFTGGALVRFCSSEYVQNITPETDTSSYVVYGMDDFLAAKEVPALQPHFQDAGTDTEMGSTVGLAALKAHLASQGINTTAWWLDVQSIIMQALQSSAHKMAMAQHYYFTASRTNWFSLLRFDMMMDSRGGMFLMEVNMSPGLFKPDVPRSQQFLNRRLIHDLLTLKGLAPGGHNHPFTNPEVAALKYNPDAVILGLPQCGGGCSSADECNGKPECILCRECRSSWQNQVLSTFMAEQLNAGSFQRIHPPGRPLAMHLKEQGIAGNPEVEQRPDDLLIRSWVETKCASDFRWC